MLIVVKSTMFVYDLPLFIETFKNPSCLARYSVENFTVTAEFHLQTKQDISDLHSNLAELFDVAKLQILQWESKVYATELNLTRLIKSVYQQELAIPEIVHSHEYK